MKNRNNLFIGGYILLTLLTAAVAAIMYELIFFTALPWFSEAVSKVILYVLVIICLFIGFMLTFRKRRNDLNIVANVLIPFGLYTAAAYRDYYSRIIIAAFILFAVFSAVYIAGSMIWGRGPDGKTVPRAASRIKHGLLGTRIILAACMLSVMLVIGVRVVSGSGVIGTPLEQTEISARSDEWTVRNNIDTVRLLEEDSWSGLSPREKLDVLEVIAKIEMRYLGITYDLTLVAEALDEGLGGYYNHSDHEIALDIDHLANDPAELVLDSLCHEFFHCYQHQMLELYSATPEEYRNMLAFASVPDYAEEFTNYSRHSDNPEAYNRQTVEMEARIYARTAVSEYYDLIEEYTGAE